MILEEDMMLKVIYIVVYSSMINTLIQLNMTLPMIWLLKQTIVEKFVC
jgi:hypothetical protein